MNLFKDAAAKIRKSALVIPVFGVFVVLGIISVVLAIEDYNTSYAGYVLVPTRKMLPYATTMVALLPQVGQIAFGYLFLSDTDNKYKQWGLLIAGGLFCADVVTDVYFKAHGQSIFVYAIALVESVLIYTFGSEVAMTVALGMTMQLLPDTILAIRTFWYRLYVALTSEDDQQDGPGANYRSRPS